MIGRSLVFMAGVASLLGFTPASAQNTIDNRLAPGQPPVIIAYRSESGGIAPENSLAGIQYAIDRDVDMVEFCTRPTLDGGYILMHYPYLTDTTNVAEVFPDGAPALGGRALARRHMTFDYTLEEIARLRLKDPEGGNHPVPTLDAALDLSQGRLLVILHLQRWDDATLLPLLERYDGSNILFFSDDRTKLKKTAAAAGIGVTDNLTREADVFRGLEKLIEMYGPWLRMVEVTSRQLTPAFLETAQTHGVRVMLRGDRHEDGGLWQGDTGPWRDALGSGAAAFMTRHPDKVLKLLER
ncbi:glycerophosphodiester phosphodiesterase family protein [Marimonas lutisalis]|uniref:glycerophosphodiester phosphodiesterase family protein n=1 Tax=Marimonas lutisalis TaxID=2545756 RepID=UPI0010F6EB14|nr:glycerophosphodiester phosphodiesterase family protein [Marimonas lutisalis]